MQLLQVSSILPASPERCARALLSSVPSIMRFIRAEMRGHRQARLTVPQFRSLVFVNYHHEASLSELAEHVGLSLPAASRMVSTLAKRRLLARQPHSRDRRRLVLALTPRGRAAFETARRATQAAVARRFAELAPADLGLLSAALDVLADLFAGAAGRSDAAK